jgi:hypothetical protein
MALRCGALAAVLRLAGPSPRRCRSLPERHSAAPSGTFNSDFQVEQLSEKKDELILALMGQVKPVQTKVQGP